MNAIPTYLSLEIRTSNGIMTEFHQSDPKLIRETLRLLATPRLFTQPQLFIASGQTASAFTGRSIDVILARTDAPIRGFLPVGTPAGPIDIFKSNASVVAADLGLPEDKRPAKAHKDGLRVVQVQVQTLGGWSCLLVVRAQMQGTSQDRRRTFANFFTVPIIPFHLETDGIGLINPGNLTCTNAYPCNDDQPETALPLKLSRRSSFSSSPPTNLYLSSHETTGPNTTGRENPINRG